ncbi:SsgA family sporulation/cell division regulator [Streptomyces yaanensis]|uniref:SsgA family sporulation/cell division regulator n=1 Tax=Streptomyces yaanensis TaxID=1142239 RepID=A0ABV7S813_9ACTN|nr:SsgA family sporulation/cell division regulator [Streptomyces sp. CGMCC 4.7035]WNB99938.1 SsgA family sporulation/cell division regulator [Streptomyces sp. CGMCC 4.7035]
MTQSFSGAGDWTSVTHEVVVHVIVTDEPPISLPAELRYDRRDPYAVCLSLGGTSTGTVDWVFARSLLAQGLRRPVGEGDVLVLPGHRCHRNSVRLVVRSTKGAAVLEIAASAVTVFLQQADLVVPPGAEGLHIDLDRLIAELMAGRE